MGNNEPQTSAKLLYLFIFCVILTHHSIYCGKSNTKITNYTITTRGYDLCTVHLKSFTNKPAEREVFHQIVAANQGSHVLWTIWDHNASSSVNPSIHFYENCSINVVLDFLPVEAYIPIRNYVRIHNTYS
jgi:hypothetical protein